MSKSIRFPAAPPVPVSSRDPAVVPPEATRGTRPVDQACGTCGATFATEDALRAHLVDAFHGFQCLRCGALYARRGEHWCPWRSPVPG